LKKMPSPSTPVGKKTHALTDVLQQAVFRFMHHPVVDYSDTSPPPVGISNIQRHWMFSPGKAQWCSGCGEHVDFEQPWEMCDHTGGYFCQYCSANCRCHECEIIRRHKQMLRESREREQQ